MFATDNIFETGKVESSRVVVVVVGVQALNASHLDLDRHASNNVNSRLTSTHSETRSTYAIKALKRQVHTFRIIFDRVPWGTAIAWTRTHRESTYYPPAVYLHISE